MGHIDRMGLVPTKLNVQISICLMKHMDGRRWIMRKLSPSIMI